MDNLSSDFFRVIVESLAVIDFEQVKVEKEPQAK